MLPLSSGTRTGRRRGFRTLLFAALAFGLARGAGAAAPVRKSADSESDHDRAPTRRVVNQVLELLDQPVFVELGTDHGVWESPAFDTAQFDSIVIKSETHPAAGYVFCEFQWKFGPDDWFPSSAPVLPTSGNWQYQFEPSPLFYVPVQGLQGRVACLAFPGYVFGGVPGPARGTVDHVRVLLRRK